MVSLPDVESSNSQIATSLPRGLVAVFVGATNGIGETTLRQFARFTVGLRPKVWFVGRAQDAGDRIAKECKGLNPDGEFRFIQADVSLLKNVDEVCLRIRREVDGINVLFMSQGTMETGIETEEGVHLPMAVAGYGRTRFMVNLLPLIQRASGLRRVVSCFVGSKEGPVDLNNIQGRGMSASQLIQFRGHGASMTTLSMEHLAKQAPNVSFVHAFPGPVKSGISRGRGWGLFIMRTLFSALGPLIFVPLEESGQRHLYLCTSARYPAKVDEKPSVVAVADGLLAAKSTDGLAGGGVYTVDEKCESAGDDVDQVLAGLRKDGTADQVWRDFESEGIRITGTVKL